jgi:hypothetical protein
VLAAVSVIDVPGTCGSAGDGVTLTVEHEAPSAYAVVAEVSKLVVAEVASFAQTPTS